VFAPGDIKNWRNPMLTMVCRVLRLHCADVLDD
jgi:hypothetical protein